MVEHNSIETHSIYPNLSATPLNAIPLRLNEINEFKDYFVAEIKKNRINEQIKYIASFDYFNKSFKW